MFPVSTAGAPPFQCMGQSGGTVNIWRWNAEWQKDLGKDGAGIWDVDDQYLEFSGTTISKSRRVGHLSGSYRPEPWPIQLRIWSGNIMSDPTLRVSSVEDLNANGFSTLTTQSHQDVIGNGVWSRPGSLRAVDTPVRPGALS